MSSALGMIETLGFIGTAEAADAMVKAASVTIAKYESIGAGYTTTLIQGDVGAVQAAIEAGRTAAERVGETIIAVHIIPNLSKQVETIIFNQP